MRTKYITKKSNRNAVELGNICEVCGEKVDVMYLQFKEIYEEKIGWYCGGSVVFGHHVCLKEREMK